MLHGQPPGDEHIVRRAVAAHRAEQVRRVARGAQQLRPVHADGEQVGRAAHGQAADILPPEQARAAARGEPEQLVAGGGRVARGQPVQQVGRADLLEQVGGVVGGAAVHGEAHGHAEAQHLGQAHDAAGELHVRAGAVRHARARFGQRGQLRVVEVDAVRVEHVRPDPAQAFHIGKRPQPGAREREALLVLRLAQVRVQPHAVGARERRALTQQVRRDGERRARREHHLPHGQGRRVVIRLDQAAAVGQDGVRLLHDGIRRQPAVLFRQAHAAARGVQADAQRRGRLELRVDEPGLPGGEHIVVVKTRRAAKAHQLGHAGKRALVNGVRVQIGPDAVERGEPVEQLHALHLGQVAREVLVQVVVRVHQPRIHQQRAPVDHAGVRRVKPRADGGHRAAVEQQVRPVQDAVLIVAGDERMDVLQQRLHI